MNTGHQQGFTLLELMITLVIIGVLASVALPTYQDYLTRARLSEMAVQMDAYADRLKEYQMVTGAFPNDTHVDPPPEVPMPSDWYDTTLIGGNFNWEGPDGYPYAGIAILGATAPDREIAMLDRILDDGVLTTGSFRITPNGRHTWILDE